MAGNSFGKVFTLTTAGESHGPGYMCIVDGCPPGLALTKEDIQHELNRRRPGQSAYTTPRNEKDQVEIMSGVFEGVTTGVPIGLLIRNTDQRSLDYSDIKDKFRPGHGDFTYLKKYGLRDYRGSGRASARETAMRVAAGAIARKYLRDKYSVDAAWVGSKQAALAAGNITKEIRGYLTQLGEVKASKVDFDQIDKNPFFCADKDIVPTLEEYVDKIRNAGDSVGARVRVEARGVPVGLGEPVFDRLDADLAKAIMSINAVKGVEIGEGFDVVGRKGSEHRDEMSPQSGFLTNNAGGILAGISTGQNIVVSCAFKPASSIQVPGRSVDRNGSAVEVITRGRHDPCVGIRGVPVAEAMVALVLIDHLLRQRGFNPTTLPPTADELQRLDIHDKNCVINGGK